jgi:hypothetical protein
MNSEERESAERLMFLAAALRTYKGIWLARFKMKILNKSNRIRNLDAMVTVILTFKMKEHGVPE